MNDGVTSTDPVDVSVLISTWNNAKRLRITLSAFCRCVIPPATRWELVLVNNSCTDDTDDVAAAFKDRLPIVYVHEPTPGVSNGRNAGLATASGRLILFTDDDVCPNRDWIETLLNAYRAKSHGFFFGGPVASEFEVAPSDVSILRFAPFSVVGLNYGKNARKLKAREYFIGANWGCPAEVIRQIGGFSPGRGPNPVLGRVRVGSETELMARLRRQGWVPWYVPDAQVTHFVPANKITQEHIVARYEAGVFQRARDSLSRHTTLGRANVLCLLHMRALKHWLVWKIAGLFGRSGIRSGTAWRSIRAALRQDGR
jgi:GT2 family glycosyltransferase